MKISLKGRYGEIHLAQVSDQCRNGFSNPTKRKEFLEKVSEYELLKNDSAAWS